MVCVFDTIKAWRFAAGPCVHPTRPLRQADREPQFAAKLKVEFTSHYRSAAARLFRALFKVTGMVVRTPTTWCTIGRNIH